MAGSAAAVDKSEIIEAYSGRKHEDDYVESYQIKVDLQDYSKAKAKKATSTPEKVKEGQ